VHEADEPDFVGNLFDADVLTGWNLRPHTLSIERLPSGMRDPHSADRLVGVQPLCVWR
jgi:hypothetical protein